MSNKPVKEGRRKFLKGMAAIGGGAAVAVAAGGAVADTQRSSKFETGVRSLQPKGYQLTPHIERYYEKARF
jgi:phosphodiesterase/alkaline phosphatase D-like protein